MDSSFSLKDQIWFLRMCHHVSNVLYKGASFLGRACRVHFSRGNNVCLECIDCRYRGNVCIHLPPAALYGITNQRYQKEALTLSSFIFLVLCKSSCQQKSLRLPTFPHISYMPRLFKISLPKQE